MIIDLKFINKFFSNILFCSLKTLKIGGKIVLKAKSVFHAVLIYFWFIYPSVF